MKIAVAPCIVGSMAIANQLVVASTKRVVVTMGGLEISAGLYVCTVSGLLLSCCNQLILHHIVDIFHVINCSHFIPLFIL